MMLGGMLAGHSESGGEVIEKNGKKYKLFYGMSSDTAMKKHAGGVAEYRSDLFLSISEIKRVGLCVSVNVSLSLKPTVCSNYWCYTRFAASPLRTLTSVCFLRPEHLRGRQ